MRVTFSSSSQNAPVFTRRQLLTGSAFVSPVLFAQARFKDLFHPQTPTQFWDRLSTWWQYKRVYAGLAKKAGQGTQRHAEGAFTVTRRHGARGLDIVFTPNGVNNAPALQVMLSPQQPDAAFMDGCAVRPSKKTVLPVIRYILSRQ